MKLLSKTLFVDGEVQFNEDLTESGYTLSVSPVNTAILKKISVKFSFEFNQEDALFLNGYQSWTYSPERKVRALNDGLTRLGPIAKNIFTTEMYGDSHFFAAPRKRGYLHGYTYAYVRRRKEYIFFGSLAERNGFTRIIFDTTENTIAFEKDCEGREISEEYKIFDLLFLSGNDEEIFDIWFEKMNIKPLTKKVATGYTSWYNYYQNINEECVLRDLEGLKALSEKPDIFQIDDGYETYVGDWLDVSEEKFPEGLEHIAEKITSEGYKAGIWLAPFVCEEDSNLYRIHKSWLLKGEDGKPIKVGGNWSGAYALDFYNEKVRKYVSNCILHYKNMGFKLFKFDFLYGVCVKPNKDKTRAEIMCEAMDFLREICGDAEIIGCGVPLYPAFGKVEYCRIGPDMSLSYDDAIYMRFFHAERPSTMRTMQNTVFRRQLNGRAFLNDPDVFLLRDENTSLTEDEKITLGIVNGLFGGVLFASDDFGKYDEKKKKIYSEIMEMPSVLDARVRKYDDYIKIKYTYKNEEKERIFSIKR